MTREYKTFRFEVKATDDEEGTITGYLSVFNVVDQGKDRVVKGAFKRTIANSKAAAKSANSPYIFPMLWQHDDTQPIGGVVDAVEDDYGLKTVAHFDLDTQRGREAYSGYKKKYLNQLSIGYDVIKKSYDEKGVRNLEELRLWEQSTVTFAMNEEALVTDVKSSARKAGRAISAANAQIIQDHCDTIHAAADKMMAMATRHTKMLHSAADDLATMLQGSEPAYTTDAGHSDDGTEPKSAPRTRALRRSISDSSTDNEMDTQMAQAMARLANLTHN